MKITWAKYKKHAGPKYKGDVRYEPPKPWSTWDKVMGVVARCEGNHDTTVMYDGTGVTWGFMQWTFKSGRLQKLLQSMKSIPRYYVEPEEGHVAENPYFNLFEDAFGGSGDPSISVLLQNFADFGFAIQEGKFYDLAQIAYLDPRERKDQRRMDAICSGRVACKSKKDQREFALDLAQLFAQAGKKPGVPEAQVEFAKAEFKRQLKHKRRPLGDIQTIENLLAGLWDTPAPALFFNLMTNNPGAAFRLFVKAYKRTYTGIYQAENFFDWAWELTNQSKFANWGWKGGANKSPRVTRIKRAMKEFYGISLPYYK